MRMTMTFLALAAVLTGSAASAEEGFTALAAETQATMAASKAQPSVKITSFYLAGKETRAAEICGQVSDAASPMTVVRITVDPKADRPGTYNVLAGRDGYFCVAVVTYTGRAEASLADSGAPPVTATASGDSRG